MRREIFYIKRRTGANPFSNKIKAQVREKSQKREMLFFYKSANDASSYNTLCYGNQEKNGWLGQEKYAQDLHEL